MDGWMHGWIDGWMNGVDGWMHDFSMSRAMKSALWGPMATMYAVRIER